MEQTIHGSSKLLIHSSSAALPPHAPQGFFVYGILPIYFFSPCFLMKTNAILTDRVVLVLNRNWQAIATLTVEQAVHRLVAGTARAMWIDDDHFQDLDWTQWIALPVRPEDPVIGTVRGPIRAPRVILLRRYD